MQVKTWKIFNLKQNQFLEHQFKMLKVSRLMAASLKILVASTQYSVA